MSPKKEKNKETWTFDFDLYDYFVHAEKDHDLTYAKLPLNILSKEWSAGLTLAEWGLLFNIVLIAAGNQRRYSLDTTMIRRTSNHDTTLMRVGCLERFQQLGIVSNLTRRTVSQLDSQLERKKTNSLKDIPIKEELPITKELPLPLNDSPSYKRRNNLEPDSPRHQVDQFDQVVKAFNEVTGKRNTLTEANQRRIAKWLKAGYKVEDFRLVFQEKFLEWKDSPVMQEHIKLPVLLSRDHFEDYLEAAKQPGSYVEMALREATQDHERELRVAAAEAELMARLNEPQGSKPQVVSVGEATCSEENDDDDYDDFDLGVGVENPHKQEILEADLTFGKEFLERVRQHNGDERQLDGNTGRGAEQGGVHLSE